MELPTLNDKETRDYGGNTPFLPRGPAIYECTLMRLVFHDGYKGKAFHAHVRVDETNRDDVFTGQQYVRRIQLSFDDKTKQTIRMKELRELLAAACGADPRDEDFDGDSVRDLFIAESEDGVINEGKGMKLRIQAEEVHKDSKVFTNYRYYPAAS